MNRLVRLLMVFILVTSLSAVPSIKSSAESQIYATGNVISSGYGHTCVVQEDGNTLCWGLNSLGQGNVSQSVGRVTQIDAGNLHTCAINVDGFVRCWGHTDSGRIDVPSDLGKTTQITAGGLHTCALSVLALVNCWGWNSHGQSSVPATLGEASEVSAGQIHTCAVTTSALVKCWGYDGNGQTDVPSNLGKSIHVSAGGDHTCAISASNKVYCWGRNDHGQTTVPQDLDSVIQISAGYNHTCALTASNEVKCWGDFWNDPTYVPSDLGEVVLISSGMQNVCAVTFNAAVRCWGTNEFGQNNVPTNLKATLSKEILGTLSASLSGTPIVGKTISSNLDSSMEGIRLSYQWMRDGAPISDANSSSYTIQSKDILRKISLHVTATKAGFAPKDFISVYLVPIKERERLSAIRFTGNVQVGSTVAVSASPKNSKFDYSYQWIRNGSEIVGANTRLQRLSASDIGSSLSVRVCALYMKEVTNCLTQDLDSAVKLGTLKNVKVSISGVAKVGRMIVASRVTPDSHVSVTYEWLRNGEPISHALTNTYFIEPADKGSSISLRVTVTKPGYETVVKTSSSKLIN